MLQFPQRSRPGQGVPARQIGPRAVNNHPACKQDPITRQIEGRRRGFQAVVARDGFDKSQPLPERDFPPRRAAHNHFDASRPECLQRLIFRIRFTGEQQRAHRLGTGSGNSRQECFCPDPTRQVDQHRPILQLDPAAVGGTETVGETGQMHAGNDLLHKIQSSSRTAACSHKETPDQGTNSCSKHSGFTLFEPPRRMGRRLGQAKVKSEEWIVI